MKTFTAIICIACFSLGATLVFWLEASSLTKLWIGVWVTAGLYLLSAIVATGLYLRWRKHRRQAEIAERAARHARRQPTDPELIKRIETAKRLQLQAVASGSSLHDPIEDEAATAQIIKQVRERAAAEVDKNLGLGRCHAVWSTMRKILKAEHNIVWYSPSAMNPDSIYD